MAVPRHVIYMGTTDDAQVVYGGHSDPRGILTVGETYVLIEEEVHPWKTNYTLEGYENYEFNSVVFEDVQ